MKSAQALDPKQPASSYIRTNFTSDDGLLASIVNDIAQSRDGTLWLNVQGTLTRFDGRRFSGPDNPWRVTALTMAPNNDLWVGVLNELEQVPASGLNELGHLPATSYHTPSGSITLLHFSRTGVLWVGTDHGLYRFESGVFSTVIPDLSIQRIEETSNGHLLVITLSGFQELDGSKVIPHPELEAQLGVTAADIFHVFEDSHGATWFCTKNGVARRVGGTMEKLEPYGPKGHQAFRAYEDPDGGIWFARLEGLFRATASGLELAAAGVKVTAMYGDREGDLWVGTNGDSVFRLKDRAVRMFTTADGLPGNTAMTVLATHDGAVWSGFNCGGIARFDGHGFRTYNEKDGLLNSCVNTLAEDANHDLWIGTYGGLFQLHDGKFLRYAKAQGLANDAVQSLVAARDGSLWAGTGSGLSRVQNGEIRNYTSLDGLPSNHVIKVFESRAGEIWVATTTGLSQFVGDHFVSPPFLPQGAVQPLQQDRAGNLYFTATPLGEIFRMENNRQVNLITNVGATNMIDSGSGNLWFSGWRILRVSTDDLDQRLKQGEPLNFEAFGAADGLTTIEAGGGHPNSTLARDGKMWIATFKGLAMFDLPRMPKTEIKPEIYMEMVTVGRNQQIPGRELVLPAGTNHLELNFDAIEISSPEKIRLQYRLDGVDSEWLDSDPPGHAVYSTLGPGTHAFHIRSCNRSGIWDRAGTVYYVIQQPYFYQTRWFVAAIISLGLLMIVGFYQLRMRQVARSLSARFDERLAERTRIARELHDTLLQTFSASLLRFQSVLKMLPARPDEAKQRVESVIEQASNAIAEGRDAVHELRSGGLATTDLAQSINNFASELVSSFTGEHPPEFRVQVEGAPRNLNSTIRDEAYRIAAEALRNAIRYAGAKQIEVEIWYGEQQLRLRIRDDGKGIDPGVLEQGHAPGRWGLRGMRERAKLLGGTFEVWSKTGSGTEVELTVPAARAYTSHASRWAFFLRSWRK